MRCSSAATARSTKPKSTAATKPAVRPDRRDRPLSTNAGLRLPINGTPVTINLSGHSIGDEAIIRRNARRLRLRGRAR